MEASTEVLSAFIHLILTLVWAPQIFASLHATTRTYHVIECDKLRERQGITLAHLIANGDTPQKTQTVRAQVAGIFHMCPDIIFKFAGFPVANVSINLQYITACSLIHFLCEPQGWLQAMLRDFQYICKINFRSMFRLN